MFQIFPFTMRNGNQLYMLITKTNQLPNCKIVILVVRFYDLRFIKKDVIYSFVTVNQIVNDFGFKYFNKFLSNLMLRKSQFIC